MNQKSQDKKTYYCRYCRKDHQINSDLGKKHRPYTSRTTKKTRSGELQRNVKKKEQKLKKYHPKSKQKTLF